MKKEDFLIVGFLLVLLFAWMTFSPSLQKKYFPQPEPAPVEVSESTSELDDAPEAAQVALSESIASIPDVVAEAAQLVDTKLPEEKLYLSNDNIELSISSHGGAILSAVLRNYPA